MALAHNNEVTNTLIKAWSWVDNMPLVSNFIMEKQQKAVKNIESSFSERGDFYLTEDEKNRWNEIKKLLKQINAALTSMEAAITSPREIKTVTVSASNNSSSFLHSAAPDAVGKIFEFIPLRQRLRALPLVCKAWHQLSPRTIVAERGFSFLGELPDGDALFINCNLIINSLKEQNTLLNMANFLEELRLSSNSKQPTKQIVEEKDRNIQIPRRANKRSSDLRKAGWVLLGIAIGIALITSRFPSSIPAQIVYWALVIPAALVAITVVGLAEPIDWFLHVRKENRDALHQLGEMLQNVSSAAKSSDAKTLSTSMATVLNPGAGSAAATANIRRRRLLQPNTDTTSASASANPAPSSGGHSPRPHRR